MSERTRKINQANFRAEVAFAATLILSMITIFCIIVFDEGKPGGPWSYVLGGLLAACLLVCVFGISVTRAARKEGIKHLPNLGDYIYGHRNQNEER